MNYFFEDNTKDALKSLEEHHKRVEEREKKNEINGSKKQQKTPEF